ncbi:hypothetical protein ACM01_27095 [Streptomyces viridochromogenes]|uniref:DUF7224 domain-containing protein n=1 Tax=Streptomyces viridochromogenes TaxID=1938 RepID=A0A0J8C128_STRVR|nr:hypothetical protein [Streptomyces viridochromogenes]KMS71425.1 hypothetical protein ACM01_27095 [Streptomyces viridochromogenes]
MVMFRLHPRANAAVPAAPVLLCIVVLYVTSDYVAGDLDGYWTAATAKAVSALIFIAPVTAACAAWEAGRLRRAKVGDGTPTRNGWQIAAASLAPVMLLGFLALAAALAVVRLQMESAPGWPDVRIIAAACVILCAHVALGYAVGMWLPAVAAVPVVLVGDYLWNVYPPALEPLWLRHLTQPAFGCCSNASAVYPGAVTAPALVAVGLAALAVAAAAVCRRTPRRGSLPGSVPYWGAALAVVAATVTTSAGVRLVDGLGPDAIEARPVSDLVCADPRGTRVCVWPEHASRLTETARTVSTAVERLRRVGVSPPEVVTESGQRPGTGQWTVTVRQDPAFTDQDLVTSLTSDLTVILVNSPHGDGRTHCPADPATAAQRAFDSQDQLGVWLSVRAGRSQQEARDSTDPRIWAPVGRVLGTSAASQETWFQDTLVQARCMPR